MKTFFLIIFSCLLSYLPCGQVDGQPSNSNISHNGASSNNEQKLQTEIQEELSHYKDGPLLYRQSDLFQRMILRRVEHRLEPGNRPSIEEPLDTIPDTTRFADISQSYENENEASIAINRSNPNLIAVGANDNAMYQISMPVYLSTNAGVSWNTYRLPQVNDHGCVAGGDPMLVCDNAGNFYYAFLIYYEVRDTGKFISDVMVAHSTDGKNWTLGHPLLGNSLPAFTLEDKETIAVDRDSASPYFGRVYVAWTHYIDVTGGSDSYQLISHSDDGGITWSTPTQIITDFGYFALLRVGKGGTLFFASSTYGGDVHGMMVSHDGGATFDEYPVANFIDYPYNDNSVNGLKGHSGFRAFPYIHFDVDPSDNTLYTVYGTYQENKYAALYAVKSTDEGKTWSTPSQIGTPGLLSTDHFMPWVSFDPVLKKSYVSFYSSEEDTTANIKSRAVRCNFETVDSIENLSQNLFNPKAVQDSNGYNFIGDYMSSDSYDGYFAAAWTEKRPDGADGDIFSYVSYPVPIVTQSVQPINISTLEVSEPTPNPVLDNLVTLHITSNDAEPVTIRLFDPRGLEASNTTLRVAAESPATVQFDLHSFSAGVYRAIISDGRQIFERNIVVLH